MASRFADSFFAGMSAFWYQPLVQLDRYEYLVEGAERERIVELVKVWVWRFLPEWVRYADPAAGCSDAPNSMLIRALMDKSPPREVPSKSPTLAEARAKIHELDIFVDVQRGLCLENQFMGGTSAQVMPVRDARWRALQQTLRKTLRFIDHVEEQRSLEELGREFAALAGNNPPIGLSNGKSLSAVVQDIFQN